MPDAVPDPNPRCGALRLTDWGLIVARGPDAAAFLHGQLTQDLKGLGSGQARLAGYCSPKGRLLASFLMWRPDDESIALACSADLLAATLKRLSQFVLRAKCTLADRSAEWSLWGLVGGDALAWLGDAAQQAQIWQTGKRAPGEALAAGRWIRLPDVDGLSRWLWLQPAGDPAPPLPALDATAWSALEVRSGIVRITAATADHFVPQMVNLELVGGVDFQKGCYPGQEVVARSQYRGTLKRRLVIGTSFGPLQAAADVLHSSEPGQPAGEVVLATTAAGSDGRCVAQVEVKLAMLDVAGSFSVNGQALEISAPPYPLPSQAGPQ